MELAQELIKLEKLLVGSGLLMEKYKKKVINLEREKNELKASYEQQKPEIETLRNQETSLQLKPEIDASRDQETCLKKDVSAIKDAPISQLQIKKFQEDIQRVIVEQRNFQKELDSMRLSKQIIANETVVLQNSLTKLKHEFRTRGYADRDMQIVKQEVQRVWHQKQLSDEQRKQMEAELSNREERFKEMEQKLKHKMAELNKTNVTLNVYKIILKEQQQQIQHRNEEIQKQSLIIEKQRQHLENYVNELETSKFNKKQTLLNLEIKTEEENRLKDMLSQKKKENMNLKMDLFIVQERLSESQHQQELAATKLKWNEKYWNYYQSRLEAQDSELRSMRFHQDYLCIKDDCLTLGSRNDLVICSVGRLIEDVTQEVDDQLIKPLAQNHPSLMLKSSLDNPLSPTSISTQQQYKLKIATLEMELQKKSELLDSQEKYNKDLEYHISLLHQIFLGKLCKL